MLAKIVSDFQVRFYGIDQCRLGMLLLGEGFHDAVVNGALCDDVLHHHGFGEAATATISTAIRSINNENVVTTRYFSVNGMHLSQPQRGINLRVSKLSNGMTVTDKVVEIGTAIVEVPADADVVSTEFVSISGTVSSVPRLSWLECP